MNLIDFRRRLQFCIERSRVDGIWVWSRDLTAKVIGLPEWKPELADPEVQKIFRALQEEGEIEMVGAEDVYVKIFEKRDHIKEIILAGLSRSFKEGIKCWSKNEFLSLVNPPGYNYKVSDPALTKILKELERQRTVRYNGSDPCFIEVLNDPTVGAGETRPATS